MLKAVACDDEPLALDYLTQLLSETGQVEVVASCLSAQDAVGVINRGGVDLAVLDVEMSGASGVHVCEAITATPKPLIVFATAHSEYALDAFEVEAIDFILKPLDQARIARAVDKAVRLSAYIRASETEAGGADVSNADAPRASGSMLAVRDAGRTYFIPHDDVYWIEAAGDYSLVHAVDREYAVRIPIRALEDMLPSDRFIRVHRSAIISAAHVREIHRLAKGEATLILSTGAVVKASRSHRDAVYALEATLSEVRG